MNSNTHLPLPRPDVAIDRLGLRLARQLAPATENLGHDVTERLRFARQMALDRAAAARRVAAAAGVSTQANGVAVLSGPPSMWLRLASMLPLVVLVAGLMLINHAQDQDQISAAAEIDSALLADELPPAAYSDPGFQAFLKATPTP